MKVLFCPCHYVFDDGERGSELSWAYNIADIVASKNPKSIVATGFKNVRENKKYKIVELQKNKNSVDLGIFNAFKFSLQYSKFTYLMLRKEKFDVVHHVLPFGIDRTFNLFFLFCKAYGVLKVIGPIQNQLPFYKDNIHDAKLGKQKTIIVVLNRVILMMLGPILKILSLATLKSANKIIVINETTKKTLLTRGIDSKKIVVIPPGIDCKRFVTKRDKIRKTVEILSVGTLIERKGFDLLIKGISEVIKTHQNIIVRIVGDGPQREYLLKQVKKLSLEKYIIFEGLVPHYKMELYYKRANIFISMSRFESWGQMYLEAMASGLPIISAKNIGSESIVQDNLFGYLVPQEDYLALSNKIVYLLNKPDMIREFGKRARQKAEEYDWEKVIIPKYIQTYNSLI